MIFIHDAADTAVFERGVFMKQRVITAIILGLVAVPICIFSGTVAFPIVLAVLGAVGVWELLGCMGTRKNPLISVPLYIFALAAPFVVRYTLDARLVASLSSVIPYRTVRSYDALLVMLGIYVLYLLGVWVFSYQKDQNVDMNKMLASVLVSLYIISATSSIVLIRDSLGGEYYWYFIFIGAWVTDTFAYFTGMLFGKHKLIPNVSPKKTVEGAIGGTVFCIIIFVVYGAIVNNYTQHDISLIVLAVAGLLSAIVSMIGDLSMSVIKRTYGIKDYGKIFPGHGGVLDRFDSILAVSVVLALFLAW